MEIALAVRRVWRYKIWLVPVALLAVAAALASTYRVGLLPPTLESKSFEYGAASAKVLLDSSDSSLAQLDTPIGAISERAALYAELLDTQPVRAEMGKQAGVPAGAISVSGQTEAGGEPAEAERSSEIVSAGEALTLFFSVSPRQPIISLYSQAPTAAQARRIVTGSVASLQRYVSALEVRRRVPPTDRIDFQLLGVPQAGTLASGAATSVGFLVALLVFGLGCLLILLIPRFLLDLRRAAAAEHQPFEVTEMPSPGVASNGELDSGSGAALNPASQGRLDRG